MALICDTGGIYALYDADDIHHIAVRAVVEAEAGPLYLPSILLAELDSLLTTRLGPDAELDFLEGLSERASCENCWPDRPTHKRRSSDRTPSLARQALIGRRSWPMTFTPPQPSGPARA